MGVKELGSGPSFLEKAPPPAAAWFVVAAGVCAAMHVGKLAPAITALQQSLGLTIVEAGFLLSLVQFAGMCLGIGFGALADGLGHRRTLMIGLALLALASTAGATASGVTALMGWRALEGLGFLMVALPAPALVRSLVPPQRVTRMLGVWGAFMPMGMAIAMLVGPLVIPASSWQSWWFLIAIATLVVLGGVAVRVPPQPAAPSARAWAGSERLRRTLGARGPWLVAVCFGTYSAQWLAVIGFLPTVYAQAGVSGAATGALSALAAGVNVVGNVAAGWLLHHGVRPTRLIALGLGAMAIGSIATFAGGPGEGLPPTLRYLAVLVFSGCGGMIPSTLFTLAVRLAPGEGAVATTIGFVYQWSALGQFIGPPLAAWVSDRAGGWQSTWWVTGAFALAGLWLCARLAAALRARAAPAG